MINFKVGDRVNGLDRGNGEIVQVDPISSTYRVKYDNGKLLWSSERRLTLITASQTTSVTPNVPIHMNKFNVGDIVETNDDLILYTGRKIPKFTRGQIVSNINLTNCYEVDFGASLGTETVHFKNIDLYLLNQAITTPIASGSSGAGTPGVNVTPTVGSSGSAGTTGTKSKFQVGDTVISLINDRLVKKGDVGYIVKVLTHNGLVVPGITHLYDVVFKGNTSMYYEQDLQGYSTSNTYTSFGGPSSGSGGSTPTQGQNTTQTTTIPKSKFSVGDSIILLRSPFPNIISGSKGHIISYGGVHTNGQNLYDIDFGSNIGVMRVFEHEIQLDTAGHFFKGFGGGAVYGNIVYNWKDTKENHGSSITKKACECGAHKCGHNGHSSWCPLYS